MFLGDLGKKESDRGGAKYTLLWANDAISRISLSHIGNNNVSKVLSILFCRPSKLYTKLPETKVGGVLLMLSVWVGLLIHDDSIANQDGGKP